MISASSARSVWITSILTAITLGLVAGCETGGQTGALVGVGVGALIGQAAGGSTEATLIGAAVGSGVGYIIGNEKDKKQAQTSSTDASYSTADSPLSGTTWQVVSVVPEPDPPFRAMTVYFRPDGYVDTTKTLDGGELVKASERYRTVDQTLIVNKPGYLINAEYAVDGDQLIISCDRFRGVLTRVGS